MKLTEKINFGHYINIIFIQFKQTNNLQFYSMDIEQLYTTLDNSTNQTNNEEMRTNLQIASLKYLIYILNECQQERGGFSFEQAYQIKLIFDKLGTSNEEKEITPDQQKKDLNYLFTCISIPQNKGKLSLKEAYYCHMCINNFIKPLPLPHSLI